MCAGPMGIFSSESYMRGLAKLTGRERPLRVHVSVWACMKLTHPPAIISA